LPSPAAAALVAWFHLGRACVRPDDHWRTLGGLAITLFAGLTMVTNVPFYSGKSINLRRSIPFVVILLVVLALALASVHPPLVLSSFRDLWRFGLRVLRLAVVA
jgi:CDP-diacylglycerol--serine O-phosphatidyltransferase